MFTLQTKPLSLKWGRGVKSVLKVTVNSKEENSYDFCPKNSASGQEGANLFRWRNSFKVYRMLPLRNSLLGN
jgi:hypothetical protein